MPNDNAPPALAYCADPGSLPLDDVLCTFVSQCPEIVEDCLKAGVDKQGVYLYFAEDPVGKVAQAARIKNFPIAEMREYLKGLIEEDPVASKLLDAMDHFVQERKVVMIVAVKSRIYVRGWLAHINHDGNSVN